MVKKGRANPSKRNSRFFQQADHTFIDLTVKPKLDNPKAPLFSSKAVRAMTFYGDRETLGRELISLSHRCHFNPMALFLSRERQLEILYINDRGHLISNPLNLQCSLEELYKLLHDLTWQHNETSGLQGLVNDIRFSEDDIYMLCRQHNGETSPAGTPAKRR